MRTKCPCPFPVLLTAGLCTERGGSIWEEQWRNYLTFWRMNLDFWDQRWKHSNEHYSCTWGIQQIISLLQVITPKLNSAHITYEKRCLWFSLQLAHILESGSIWAGGGEFLWMTLHFIVIMTFTNLSWYTFLMFLLLLWSMCQSNPQGPVCLHGSVIFPWWGPVARQTLWEYTKDKDTWGLRWQVGHRYRGGTPWTAAAERQTVSC